jgi:hypothetical protein
MVMLSYLKHWFAPRPGGFVRQRRCILPYAARAGIEARPGPETASYPKIVQMAATGADVATTGSRQDVADAALVMSAEIFYASHNWQAFFAEGTKTLAYELWEQMGFRAPDNIVLPLGYGSNVLGCEHGFSELLANAEIERMPRIFAVQAANCAPCVQPTLQRRPSVHDPCRSPRACLIEANSGARSARCHSYERRCDRGRERRSDRSRGWDACAQRLVCGADLGRRGCGVDATH